jgi:hypothetical protein
MQKKFNYSNSLFCILAYLELEKKTVSPILLKVVDKDTVIKLCKLFSNKKITLPTIEELQRVLDSFNYLYATQIDKIEKGSIDLKSEAHGHRIRGIERNLHQFKEIFLTLKVPENQLDNNTKRLINHVTEINLYRLHIGE